MAGFRGVFEIPCPADNPDIAQNYSNVKMNVETPTGGVCRDPKIPLLWDARNLLSAPSTEIIRMQATRRQSEVQPSGTKSTPTTFVFPT